MHRSMKRAIFIQSTVLLTVPEASLFFVEDEKSTHVVRAYQLNDNTTSTIVKSSI